MIRRSIGITFILLMGMMCSQAYATHIQYVSLADVSDVVIKKDDLWTKTFDLVNHDMDLWELDSPTSTTGPSPAPALYTGSYDPSDVLHYVYLRIDPNNIGQQGGSVSTSTYIGLSINDTLIPNWSNRITLYSWGSNKSDFYDPYGIATNDYKIKLTLTGLAALGNNKSIDVTNVNLEGCFDTTTPVPEPATLFLLGAGLTCLGRFGRKVKKS